MAHQARTSNRGAFGAVDVECDRYVLPHHASKGRAYACPDCKRKVVLRAGAIRSSHFAHSPGEENDEEDEARCAFYGGGGGESEAHLAAKLGLAAWLRGGGTIRVCWGCDDTRARRGVRCGASAPGMDSAVALAPGQTAATEVPGVNASGERYVADVAILGPDGSAPRVILEVRATHATTRARPEPWFELDARLVLEELANAQGKTSIMLGCERPTSPRKCPNCALIGAPWIRNIPRLGCRVGSEGGWAQAAPCAHCGTSAYSPVWEGGPRAICKRCLPAPEVRRRFDAACPPDATAATAIVCAARDGALGPS
jgi:Competence protein CoiA-like family